MKVAERDRRTYPPASPAHRRSDRRGYHFGARKLHERLHTHRTLEPVQVRQSEKPVLMRKAKPDGTTAYAARQSIVKH